MIRTVAIHFCLLAGLAFSQDRVRPPVLRDTSYTLYSAYSKYRKDYPFIRPVAYQAADGALRHADVCYDSSAGRPLTLDIFSMAGESDALRPAVLMVHGGGWGSGDRCLMHPLADCLAKEGFIALPVAYRLSPEARYPAAVEDIRHALLWVMTKGRAYHVDPERVVILGCSAGAQLAALTALRHGGEKGGLPHPVKAIVNIDGIMDFTSEEARKYEDDPRKATTAAGRWLGGRYAEASELWREASPLYYVDEWSPPMLFINSSKPRFHAGRDEVIAKLNAFSIFSAVKTFDDAPHSFWLFEPWFEPTGRSVVRFLERVLGG